jgi:hypothetical protein
MSASRDLLEARLERDQRELAAVLAGLRERVRTELDQLDPRRRIEERPTLWLLAAGLLGLWLGARR